MLTHLVRKTFIFIILCVISNLSGQVTFDRFTTEVGLPYDITYEMYQDDDGYLWIGTEIGLAKFDGKNFQLLNSFDNLPSNLIIAIYGLSGDSLVLGTWGDGMQIINHKGKPYFKNERNGAQKLKSLFKCKNYMYSTLYYAILEHDLSSINGEKFREFSIIKNGENIIINSGIGKSIDKNQYKFNASSIDNKIYYFFEPKQTIQNTFSFNGIYSSTAPLEKGKILQPVFSALDEKKISYFAKYKDKYVAGSKDTLYYLKDERITKKTFLNIDGSYVLKVLFYSEDEFVFTSVNEKGIKYVYLYDKGELINLNKSLALKNSVSDILIDHENSIWVSSYGDGIFHIPYKKHNYSYIDKAHFTDPNILDINKGLEDTMLLLSTDFLYFTNLEGKILKKEKMKYECKEIKLNGNQIIALCTNPKEQGPSSYIEELNGYFNTTIEGVGLVSSVGGRISINGQIKKTKFHEDIVTRCIAESKRKNCIWVPDLTSINLFDYVKDSVIYQYDHTHYFCSNRINKIFETGDSVWIATDRCLNVISKRGVYKFELLKGENVRIFDMQKDLHNNLWVATQSGLFYIDRMGIKRINQSTGLSSNYARSLCLDKEGKVWISGNAGATIIDPNNLDTKSFPKIKIEQDKCSFEINAISFNSPNAIEIEYKLNEEENWLPVLSHNLSFCNQKARQYQIKFRYRKIDSDWKETELYYFNISQPWYKTWWAVSLLTFLTLTIVILFTLYRLRISKKRNQRLNKLIEERTALEEELSTSRNTLAMDFHDDMGNKMARIALLSEIVSKEEKGIDEGTRIRLIQIKNDADVLYKSTKDFIWTLKRDSHKLDEIITYLSDFGEEYFGSIEKGFYTINDCPKGIHLPFHWNRQIIMICKEAMTNAAKHSSCDKVTLSFEYQKSNLIVTIKDNGIGIKKLEINSTRGIKHILERAKKMNAIVEYENSSPGTEMRLILNIFENDQTKND